MPYCATPCRTVLFCAVCCVCAGDIIGAESAYRKSLTHHPWAGHVPTVLWTVLMVSNRFLFLSLSMQIQTPSPPSSSDHHLHLSCTSPLLCSSFLHFPLFISLLVVSSTFTCCICICFWIYVCVSSSKWPIWFPSHRSNKLHRNIPTSLRNTLHLIHRLQCPHLCCIAIARRRKIRKRSMKQRLLHALLLRRFSREYRSYRKP